MVEIHWDSFCESGVTLNSQLPTKFRHVLLRVFKNVSIGCPSPEGGFKFQVQRVNDGAGAHRLPGAWQS